MIKMTNEAKCYEYCEPCEWFGICPHSYAEFDKKRRGEDEQSDGDD